MIVRFNPSGRSFKWLGTYLTHDPKSESAARVAWTHTFNLANDHVPSAIDEMLRTFSERELLKAEAGIRPGGAKLEKPVKHVSLSWHPSEKPSRGDMLEAALSFLQRMGWDEHQCVLVAHDDKKFRHVHLMINAVHPERGTRLNDGLERRRAQEWALGYEKEHGQVFCKERLKDKKSRQPSPPRNVWEQMREFEEPDLRDLSQEAPTPPPRRDPASWQHREWAALRAQQRDTRTAFFEGGREAYREVRTIAYRAVREQFRGEWREFYALKRSGAGTERLRALRTDVLERQREALDARFKLAAAELRKQRDQSYRNLLDGQIADRASLADRQERNLRSLQLREPEPVIPVEAPRPIEHSQTAKEAEDALAWTKRGGMAAQQRSAQVWFRRAVERLALNEPPAPISATSRLQTAAQRAQQDHTPKANAKKTPGKVLEPDR